MPGTSQMPHRKQVVPWDCCLMSLVQGMQHSAKSAENDDGRERQPLLAVQTSVNDCMND